MGFSLIPASIISYLVGEKESKLKLMQMISGMSLGAYWISNYIFDILKVLGTMVLAIGLMYAFGINQKDIWLMYLLFPFGVIPFTYAMSYIF